MQQARETDAAGGGTDAEAGRGRILWPLDARCLGGALVLGAVWPSVLLRLCAGRASPVFHAYPACVTVPVCQCTCTCGFCPHLFSSAFSPASCSQVMRAPPLPHICFAVLRCPLVLAQRFSSQGFRCCIAPCGMLGVFLLSVSTSGQHQQNVCSTSDPVRAHDACVPACMGVCLSSVCLSVWLSVCLSVCLGFCACMCVCMRISMRIWTHVFACMSMCRRISECMMNDGVRTCTGLSLRPLYA